MHLHPIWVIVLGEAWVSMQVIQTFSLEQLLHSGLQGEQEPDSLRGATPQYPWTHEQPLVALGVAFNAIQVSHWRAFEHVVHST